MTDDIAAVRRAYADTVTALAGAADPRLRAAFATIDRGRFCGPPPWWIRQGGGYAEVPAADEALIYRDVLLGLAPDRGINNGQPSLHARMLDAVAPMPGERVAQIGAGTGYYTAILAELVGPAGRVEAWELAPDLAARAAANLADRPNVVVHAGSGARDVALPPSDIVYVSAGATGPMPVWLDALRPGGRLIFPMTPWRGMGAMLLVTRVAAEPYAARFVCAAGFIPCVGARDTATARRLSAAFDGGGMEEVRSLRRDDRPDATCWASGDGWWLSTAPPD